MVILLEAAMQYATTRRDNAQSLDALALYHELVHARHGLERYLRVAVMIPTYNEALNIPVLAERLLALNPPLQVVVVDDESPDGTGQLADEIAAGSDRLHVIHRTGPRGYASASREGLRWCLDHGFEIIGTMDADLSHDPQVLPTLVAAVERGASLAIGSRYVEGGRLEVDWGPLRRAVSQTGSLYARYMIGTKVKDCTSGFRCYRATALASTGFESIDADGYCFLIELLARLTRQNTAIVEIPITYVDRRAGASKISRGIIVEALVRTTALGVRRLFGR
jgi:dolichol-phosphate mannosyltransferase